MLNSFLLTTEFFNFELELDRTTSVTFLDRLFLFYVSLDQRVLYICYPGSFFRKEIVLLFHCQSPPKHF